MADAPRRFGRRNRVASEPSSVRVSKEIVARIHRPIEVGRQEIRLLRRRRCLLGAARLRCEENADKYNRTQPYSLPKHGRLSSSTARPVIFAGNPGICGLLRNLKASLTVNIRNQNAETFLPSDLCPNTHNRLKMLVFSRSRIPPCLTQSRNP